MAYMVAKREEKAPLRKKAALLLAAFNLCMCGLGSAFASSAANSLFDKVGKLSEKLTTGLDDLYCDKLFPLLFVLDCIFLAFTKDDRKIAVEKKALITVCVVFVAIKVVKVIQATLVELTA